MKAILEALKAIYDLATTLHNPLSHDLVKDERECHRCRFHKKLRKLILEGEATL